MYAPSDDKRLGSKAGGRAPANIQYLKESQWRCQPIMVSLKNESNPGHQHDSSLIRPIKCVRLPVFMLVCFVGIIILPNERYPRLWLLPISKSASIKHNKKINDALSSSASAEDLNTPENWLIIQIDDRPIWTPEHRGPNTTVSTHTKLAIGPIWVYQYTQRHGHKYILYNWPTDAHQSATSKCRSAKNQTLHGAWCKVPALLQAQKDFPNAQYFVYMDTDAVIDISFFHDQSLNNLLHNMTTSWNISNWDIDEKPFVFSQEGVSDWCRAAASKGNYPHCLNTGTMLWKRSDKSTAVLERWWESADDPYDVDNPMNIKFRTDHPWEQYKAEGLLQHPTTRDYIQVVPEPENVIQFRAPCLMDCLVPPAPELDCFVKHYCYISTKRSLGWVYGKYLDEYMKEEQIVMNETSFPTAVLSLDIS